MYIFTSISSVISILEQVNIGYCKIFVSTVGSVRITYLCSQATRLTDEWWSMDHRKNNSITRWLINLVNRHAHAVDEDDDPKENNHSQHTLGTLSAFVEISSCSSLVFNHLILSNPLYQSPIKSKQINPLSIHSYFHLSTFKKPTKSSQRQYQK